jgi:hypothetical protein
MLCPFGCQEERNGQKSVAHFIKEHKHQLLEAIQTTGTLYACLKAREEGEPEVCCCFGCNTAWKNKTVATRHFQDEKGKECLTKHRTFLAQLKLDAGQQSIEDLYRQLDISRKETRAAKSKLYDLQVEIARLRENVDPQAKDAYAEITYLRQYIEQFGDLVFNSMRELLSEEQHKKMSLIDTLNCKENITAEDKKALAEKLQGFYYSDHLVKLRWYPSVDTYLQMKKSEGVCYSEYLPWMRICVLRNWFPKIY